MLILRFTVCSFYLQFHFFLSSEKTSLRVHFVLGIDEDGYREILNFEVNPSEGAESWAELIKRLYERGVREVLLFVADGVPGLEDKIKEYFPKADFQSCVIHKVIPKLL